MIMDFSFLANATTIMGLLFAIAVLLMYIAFFKDSSQKSTRSK